MNRRFKAPIVAVCISLAALFVALGGATYAATSVPANSVGRVDAIFGDGSDGDATLSGSNTLSRDTYYRNLTLSQGADLNTNGYRLFVSGTLTLDDGSHIGRDGISGDAGGTGLAAGTLGGSGAGGSGTAPPRQTLSAAAAGTRAASRPRSVDRRLRPTRPSAARPSFAARSRLWSAAPSTPCR